MWEIFKSKKRKERELAEAVKIKERYQETLKMLSKRFNVSFVLKNKALKDNYFTGTFDKQQLPRILEHLRISSNIRYRIIDPKSGDEGLKERSKVELY